MRTVEELAAEAGGFSRPSKPACLSFSIPATKCRTGCKLYNQPGSTCSGCYARKGMYMMSNVKKAMDRRYKLLQKALKSSYADQWIEALSAGINKQYYNTMRNPHTPKLDGRFFRWHDSGDLQSVKHLDLICKVAWNTPRVSHNLPTRETEIVAEFNEAGGLIPSNLNIKLSAPTVDKLPTSDQIKLSKTRKGITLTTVHTIAPPKSNKLNFTVCPATSGVQKTCAGCRMCWPGEKPVPNISFKKH